MNGIIFGGKNRGFSYAGNKFAQEKIAKDYYSKAITMLCAIIMLLVFEGSPGIFDFASKFVEGKRGARRRKSGEGRKGGRGCIVLS